MTGSSVGGKCHQTAVCLWHGNEVEAVPYVWFYFDGPKSTLPQPKQKHMQRAL